MSVFVLILLIYVPNKLDKLLEGIEKNVWKLN